MCVPFWCAGSATYISRWRSRAAFLFGAAICTGWRIGLTPTRWIATLRISVPPCHIGKKQRIADVHWEKPDGLLAGLSHLFLALPLCRQ